MIPEEVLHAIEEYADEYAGNSYLKDAVIHSAIYGYSIAQQQLDEKDKEIARLKAESGK